MRQTRAVMSILIFTLLVIVSSLSVAATHQRPKVPDVSLEAASIKDKALPGEWLEFDFTIRNNKVADDVFRMRIAEESTSWSVLSKPPLNNVILLGRHSKTFRLLFKDIRLPRNALRPYGIYITAESLLQGKIYSIQLPVFLLPGDLDYAKLPPNITVTLSAPERIDPRNAYSFKVNLGNNNPRPYKDLLVVLNSTLIHQQTAINLNGSESKTVDFTIILPEDQPPVEEMLSFSLLKNDTVLVSGQMPLVVVSYHLPFNQHVLVTEKFLRRTEEYTLTNEQNVLERQVFRVPMPFVKRLVSSGDPKPNVETVDGRAHFSWTIALQPGESAYVTVHTNYRVYLYGVLLVFVIIFLYYMFENPVTVIKQAEKIKTMEGGIAEMKVVLAIRNHSKTKSFACQLHERLPHMIEYLKREEHGLMPPKVIHTKKGTVLRWVLDLEPQEERIVMYYLKTRLHVLGNLRIPPAVMRITHDDAHVTVESNELDVATE